MTTAEKTLITGRRLDENGRPIDGTGFEYPAVGPVAEALAKRTSPVYSNPVANDWGFELAGPADTDGEYARGMAIMPAGHNGIPDVIHPTYAEHFEILQGDFEFRVEGRKKIAHAGETVVAPAGVRHGLRYVGEGYGIFIVETRPAGRFTEMIPMFYGLAHDGKLSKSGTPRLLQAMVMAQDLGDDTIYTSPPPIIVKTLARILAPIGRRLGYRTTYDRYKDRAFWEQRVEQPVD